ncbi:POP5 [Sanghuangporus sanghuang]
MVRFKNRWLLVEFIPFTSEGVATYAPSDGLTGKYIWNALRDSVLVNFGDTGWGAVGSSLTVKYFSPTTNLCIIRVARDHHRIAWGAVTCIRKMQDRVYLPNVIHVSGTIKHAQLAAIQHNREAVARLRAQSKLPAMYQSKHDEYLESSTKEIKALRD